MRIRDDRRPARGGDADPEDAAAAGAALITRGEQGMASSSRTGKPVHIPTAAREVFDVTGAGDTVIATLALALAAGAALPEAAMLANHAAGVVVGKLGTATVSPEEVLARRRAPGMKVGRGGRGARRRAARVPPRARRRRGHPLRRVPPAREAVRRRRHGQGAGAAPARAGRRPAARAAASLACRFESGAGRRRRRPARPAGRGGRPARPRRAGSCGARWPPGRGTSRSA